VQRNRVGEQLGPDVRGDEQRGGRQQDGGQSWRDRPGAAARNRDVPAVDGDLDGTGDRNHARRELTVPDRDRPAGPGAAVEASSAASCPRNRGTGPDPSGPARMPMRPRLIASCSTSAESVLWPSNIARSRAGQGVGRGSSCGVTIAVLASA
jgi:hypothetical protein